MSTESRRRVRSPQQARSRATLDRFVRAAATLLETSAFDDVSVEALARESKASVGAFYTRFGDKDAFLDYLEQDVVGDIEARVEELRRLTPERDGLPQIVETVARSLVRLHRSRRGVLRAVYLRDRDSTPRRAEPFERHYDVMTTILLRWRAHIAHPSPRQAVGIGLQIILGVIRERLLFGGLWAGGPPMSEDLLVDELVQALLAYFRG